ncbi:MAG: MucR family transcriptional regulator [Syntrophobacteraceae bacterium]
MPRTLIEIASEIVKAQVSLTKMTAADISSFLCRVFGTLQELQKAESAGTNLTSAIASAEGSKEASTGENSTREKPALTPENSIQENKVICLECGGAFKQLTQKHLSSHDISPKDYKKKYGFTMKTPLSAKSLTRARKKVAKKRGLPENLKKVIEARRQSKAQAQKAAAIPEISGPGAERAKKARRHFSPKKIG